METITHDYLIKFTLNVVQLNCFHVVLTGFLYGGEGGGGEREKGDIPN